MNPNGILTLAVHLWDRQTNESSIRAYNAAINFYIAEFCRSDVEFSYLFGTENLVTQNHHWAS